MKERVKFLLFLSKLLLDVLGEGEKCGDDDGSQNYLVETLLHMVSSFVIGVPGYFWNSCHPALPSSSGGEKDGVVGNAVVDGAALKTGQLGLGGFAVRGSQITAQKKTWAVP